MRLAQSRLGLDPPAVRSTSRPRGALDPSTPAGVLRLQRTAGNRATSALIARLPYQTAYSESQVRRILNQSENRLSPFTGAEGHPRQHVGRLSKAEEHAEEEGKTKSVFSGAPAPRPRRRSRASASRKVTSRTGSTGAAPRPRHR